MKNIFQCRKCIFPQLKFLSISTKFRQDYFSFAIHVRWHKSSEAATSLEAFFILFLVYAYVLFGKFLWALSEQLNANLMTTHLIFRIFVYYFYGCCCCCCRFKLYIIADSAFVSFEPTLNKECVNDRFYFCGSSRLNSNAMKEGYSKQTLNNWTLFQ